MVMVMTRMGILMWWYGVGLVAADNHHDGGDDTDHDDERLTRRPPFSSSARSITIGVAFLPTYIVLQVYLYLSGGGIRQS